MKQIKELTNTQIVEIAPAAGAAQPYSEVSEKYSFVPTITAVDILRACSESLIYVIFGK